MKLRIIIMISLNGDEFQTEDCRLKSIKKAEPFLTLPKIIVYN